MRFPMLPVGVDAFELQLGDGVKRADVGRVSRHDAVDVVCSGRIHPIVDELADPAFICSGHLQGHLSPPLC